MSQRNRCLPALDRGFATATALLLLASAALGDTIKLKDGTIVTGTVVSEDAATYTVETRGTLLKLQKSQVESVDRAVQPGATDQAIANATSAIAAGDPARAWRELLSASAEPKALEPHAALILQVGSAMYTTSDREVKAGTFQPAEERLSLILTDSGRVLMNLAGVEEAPIRVLHARARGNRLLAEARTIIVGDSFSAEAIEKLREASLILAAEDPAQSEARLLFARTAIKRASRLTTPAEKPTQTQMYDEAILALRSIRESASATAQVKAEATKALADLEQGGVRLTTERVIATPTPAVIATPAPTPEPTPEPTPVPPPSQTELLLKNAGIEIPPEVKVQIGRWALPAGVFALVFWIIPYIVLRVLERSGNIFAANRRKQVKFLGPIAILLAFKDASPLSGNAPQHACPHCQMPLDNPDLYDDLNFSQCPHCKKAVQPVHNAKKYLDDLGQSLRLEGERVEKGAVGLHEFLKTTRMERIIQVILTEAVRKRASDLHAEPEENGLRIRLRIDGIMTEFVAFPKSLANSIVSAMKARANLDVADKLRPQDGAFTFTVDDAKIDARVASSPSPNGEKLSLRLLDVRSLTMSGKKLGMTVSQREIFDKCIRLPHGLILNTGPTGSGKTTTLYIALQKIRDEDRNILSIEDPIEFRIPGINQMQVNPQAGLTFATGLRSILRLDPEVIMMGYFRYT